MSYRQRHKKAYILGGVISLAVVLALLLPSSQVFLKNGPMLPGHEELECISCHKDEQGSFRQQVQANIQYLLNKRESAVSVGLRPVENNECIECHERPNDRHPVYRFREPKYSEARKNIQADQCIACHSEHKNRRMSVAINFCMHCHDELNLKEDPVDVSHQQLIKDKNWNSCLGCHDYHGNHDMKTEDKLENAIKLKDLKNYFERGSHPYPGKIITKAKNDE